ncbi:2-hydroxychromene-2-carboxylate isomerase [Sneathiella chinensis]|uniref:2-hydroxychromene-2-carboxylate isomerase n=1 Tax=Sneathiella chinensis TaxID=349750 RepID=A0ABQ5U2Z3_9PROT|nr:2-hydroxychromene-2-carboxylate isomerase [Sneathiella chinensis]GLQ06529.1 2-hydroxychromene-2-carboxylate isomerase [Sneathiella chinensis]
MFSPNASPSSSIEFFFDCSSPWTYLAFESLQEVHGRNPELSVMYRPVLVGGVFNSVNPSVYNNRENPVPAKQAYGKKDLQDWARYVGIKIGAPPVFPVNSVKAMRGAFVALEEGCLVSYARAVFQRYWGDLQDISQDHVLTDIVRDVGLEPENFFSRITEQRYKDMLRDSTEELIRRGGFGSPTLFLNGDDMYFGNDRLPLVEAKVRGEG